MLQLKESTGQCGGNYDDVSCVLLIVNNPGTQYAVQVDGLEGAAGAVRLTVRDWTLPRPCGSEECVKNARCSGCCQVKRLLRVVFAWLL